MANLNGDRKVGEVIEETYQAPGATSGLTDITMEIFDETGLKDPVDYPDVTMVEIVSTGRYKASYIPDIRGKWRIMVNSASKKGLMVRDHNVVDHNIDSIGNAVADISSPPMFG